MELAIIHRIIILIVVGVSFLVIACQAFMLRRMSKKVKKLLKEQNQQS